MSRIPGCASILAKVSWLVCGLLIRRISGGPSARRGASSSSMTSESSVNSRAWRAKKSQVSRNSANSAAVSASRTIR